MSICRLIVIWCHRSICGHFRFWQFKDIFHFRSWQSVDVRCSLHHEACLHSMSVGSVSCTVGLSLLILSFAIFFFCTTSGFVIIFVDNRLILGQLFQMIF